LLKETDGNTYSWNFTRRKQNEDQPRNDTKNEKTWCTLQFPSTSKECIRKFFWDEHEFIQLSSSLFNNGQVYNLYTKGCQTKAIFL